MVPLGTEVRPATWPFPLGDEGSLQLPVQATTELRRSQKFIVISQTKSKQNNHYNAVRGTQRSGIWQQ